MSLRSAALFLGLVALAAAQQCSNNQCGGLPCCPDARSGNMCYTSSYSCPRDESNNNYYLCAAGFGSCNGACFDKKAYHCQGGHLAQGGSGGSSSGGSSSSSGSSGGGGGGSSTSGNNGGGSNADFTVINNCKSDLFIEARMGGAGQPLPGQTKTVRKLGPGERTGYDIPATGADGTRFWAKYGCDGNGQNCLIGDSMQYWPNPPGGCPDGGCSIPVDSLFEASWGCDPGTSCHGQKPTTWFDTSQVDGWTIPYKVNLYGNTDKCDCAVGKCANLKTIDASRLDLAKCPTNEDASWNGRYSNAAGHSMNNLDLRVIKNNLVLGCMSPCKKLTYGAPLGYGMNEGALPAVFMCCPTPDPFNCQLNNGCILSPACRAGPIATSKFVEAVHNMSPGIYAYSYDDGVGLHTCPAGEVKYEMTFCPDGSTQYPLHL